MCGTIVFGILRGLVVWFAAIVSISLSVDDPQAGNFAAMLLIVFYTIPALLLFVLLHLIETSLIRRDGAVLSLLIGPGLAMIAYAAPPFIGEVLGPVGICWLVSGIVRLILIARKPDARFGA